jgi:rubrerythrin
MDAILSASEAVDMAKQVEDAGEAFYDEALKYLEDPEVRRIFEFLRDEERRHAATFERLLETMGGVSGGWREDDEYVAYIRLLAGTQVFPDAPAARAAVRGATAGEALRLAIEFEKDSILFLHEVRPMVEEESREVVDRLIAEERIHVTTLLRLLSAVELS